MDPMQLFGWAGIILVNTAYFPQLVRTLRLRKTWQMSPFLYIMVSLAIVNYEIYAIWRNDIVFMVSNAIGLVQPALMAFLTIKWGKKHEEPRKAYRILRRKEVPQP